MGNVSVYCMWNFGGLLCAFVLIRGLYNTCPTSAQTSASKILSDRGLPMLLDMMRVRDFDVQYSCTRALLHLIRHNGEVTFQADVTGGRRIRWLSTETGRYGCSSIHDGIAAPGRSTMSAARANSPVCSRVVTTRGAQSSHTFLKRDVATRTCLALACQPTHPWHTLRCSYQTVLRCQFC